MTQEAANFGTRGPTLVSTRRLTGWSAIAASLGVVCLILASSCNQSTSTAKPPTPSAASSPTPAASPPPGGPVPAQLLGDWFLPKAAAFALNPPATGGPPCPSVATLANCFIRLSLTATTYHVYISTQLTGSGDVVVNNQQIDFFNGALCALQLPDGVGRYTWTLTAETLHLTPLTSDPCGRDEVLAYQGWNRTH
jgi:hypothetical protein